METRLPLHQEHTERLASEGPGKFPCLGEALGCPCLSQSQTQSEIEVNEDFPRDAMKKTGSWPMSCLRCELSEEERWEKDKPKSVIRQRTNLPSKKKQLHAKTPLKVFFKIHLFRIILKYAITSRLKVAYNSHNKK